MLKAVTALTGSFLNVQTGLDPKDFRKKFVLNWNIKKNKPRSSVCRKVPLTQRHGDMVNQKVASKTSRSPK